MTSGLGARAAFWNSPLSNLLVELRATPDGLEAVEAETRLERDGANDATPQSRRPLWLQFATRFANPLVVILQIASALSAATGDLATFVIVAVVILPSVGLDFLQEVRAEHAVEWAKRLFYSRLTIH